MWHGQIVDIPNGWALCDGTQGTPDLRARFVRGAPLGLNPGRTGGTDAHVHSGMAEENYDELDDGEDVTGWIGEEYWAWWTLGHGHFIDIDPAGNKPPYYEIAFIMKL